MKILVTGANGFVGSHLCEKLINEGHNVYALVRTPAKLKLPENNLLHVIKGDLDLETLSWVDSLPTDLDTVIHTAGIVHHFNTDEFFRINSDGTLHLIKNLRNKFSQLHFILISSLAAAGPSLSKQKRNEEDLDFPISLYGKSKKQAEVILKQFAPAEYILSVVRPPMVIGPRDPAVLDIFKMVKSRIILLPGLDSLKKQYSFVCVFDLVKTITLLCEYKKQESYFSAHPQTVSFQEIIQTIKKAMKKSWVLYLPMPLILIKLLTIVLNFINRFFPLNVRLTPDKYFELAASNWTCDGKKSENQLAQVYQYDLVSTIEVTLNDYKKSHWI